jgi:hypothetical protein
MDGYIHIYIHIYMYICMYIYIYIYINNNFTFSIYRRILLQNKVTKMTLFLENKYGVSSSNEYVYKLPVSYRQSRRKSLSNLEKVRTYVCTFIYMYVHSFICMNIYIYFCIYV